MIIIWILSLQFGFEIGILLNCPLLDANQRALMLSRASASISQALITRSDKELSSSGDNRKERAFDSRPGSSHHQHKFPNSASQRHNQNRDSNGSRSHISGKRSVPQDPKENMSTDGQKRKFVDSSNPKNVTEPTRHERGAYSHKEYRAVHVEEMRGKWDLLSLVSPTLR